ncbi:SIMPL domain-containing protein [Spirosoma montaniterrae]|nr:SIMPL domain-containing protein [Spirosoma montaniterrae]
MSQPVDNRILVLGDAFEDVPANQVTLTVNLSFSDERDVKLAFQEHQQAQQRLTSLLNQQKIPAQNIRFLEPLGRKGQTYLRGQAGDRFTTYQRVLLKFNDLSQFNQAQQLLTANGFTDLSAVFSVSNQREVENRLLDKALARAQEKATQLAKATQRSIKRVVRISDTSENEGFYAYRDQNRLNAQQNPVNYDNDAFRQMAMVTQVFRYAVAVKVEFELTD